jgi:hypothetical protein
MNAAVMALSGIGERKHGSATEKSHGDFFGEMAMIPDVMFASGST